MASIENVREIMSMDPFNVKKSIISMIDKNLGTKNPDLYESGFLGYLTQAQTMLTSDVLFNNALAWNEAFTHLMRLPSSVQNAASMFDYVLPSAIPCEGTISVYVPFPPQGNQYQLLLRNGTVCGGAIQYLVHKTYLINVSYTEPSVQSRDPSSGIVGDVPINIEIRDGKRFLVFSAEVWQVDVLSLEDKFSGVEYKKFYDVNMSGISDFFHDISIGVYLADSAFSEPRLIRFRRVSSIYSCGPKDNVFTFKQYGDGRAVVRFGNGVFGSQPSEGTSYQILVYMTQGKSGAAYPGQITLETNLVDYFGSGSIAIYGTNLNTIDNGVDEEQIDASKNNIIAGISSARRLVTSDDYSSFGGITGMQNIEAFPMLLRRDTNANEIDLFSVIYDESGIPAPTTNIGSVVSENTSVISKDNVYTLAMRYGENGVELVPNLQKIINPSATDPGKHELYSAIYVDSAFSNYDVVNEFWDKKIVYNYSDGSRDSFDPDEMIECVCPFSVALENRGGSYAGTFEYIPYELNDQPKIEDQADITDIEIGMKNVVFSYKPDIALVTTVKPTHINALINLSISSSIDPSLVSAYITMYKVDANGGIILLSPDSSIYEKGYPCGSRIVSSDSTSMSTAFQIPINDFPADDFVFCVSVYYSGKFYNSYRKYVKFADSVSNSLVQNFIDTPVLFSYSQGDPDEVKPTEPAIDRVYISVTNVGIRWNSWVNDDGFSTNGYEVTVELNKLKTVDDTSRIKCTLVLGYGGDEFESLGVTDFNDTIIKFVFRVPYNPNYVMDGQTYYQVKIDYAFKYSLATGEANENRVFSSLAVYSGYAVFRRKISELMWCNVEKVKGLVDNTLRIYRIPVIEKEFYDRHRDYLEDKVFYQIAQLDSRMIDYKMLTHRINFKFAKTIGSTENLRFNDYVENIDESLIYNGWTSDLPPKIHIRALVPKNTSRSKSDIIRDVKQVILSFMQLHANFNATIVRSEMARYVHDTIPDILSCEILEPARDIIYMYSADDLPINREIVLSYNPEFLWIDVSKITVDVVSAQF